MQPLKAYFWSTMYNLYDIYSYMSTGINQRFKNT